MIGSFFYIYNIYLKKYNIKMIKVRKFQTEEQFNLSVLKYPTISYIKEIDKIHFQNDESYFIAIHNVTSTTNSTEFFGYGFELEQIDKMYIDNVEVEPKKTHIFDTLGEHTVKCTFKKGVLKNCKNMFYFSNIKTLDVRYLDTSEVTNMSNMFYYSVCDNIIGFEYLDTSKVTDMSYMFGYSTFNKNFDLTRWDVSNVTDMSWMFYNTKGSFKVDISGWNAYNVKKIEYMFFYSSGITEVNASNTDFSSVEKTEYVCYNSPNLIKADFSNANFSSSTSCQYMFANSSNLRELNVENMNVQNVQKMQTMFSSCSGLTSLDLSSLNTYNLIDTSSMFYCCFSLKDLKLMKHTSNLQNVGSMFNWCHSLTKIDLSGLDFTKVTNMGSMFYSNNESQLKEIDFTCEVPTGITSVNMFSGMFNGLTTDGVLKYKCEYSDFWENILINNRNVSYFPKTWECGCVGDVSLRLKIIIDSNEIKEGNLIINNTVGAYNSEKGYWEFNYQSDVIEHDVYYNDEIIGKVYNKCNLQYLFIGELDENYSGFTITEKINVTSVTENYNLINQAYSNNIKCLLVDGEKKESSNTYKFETEGEHIVKLCFDNEDNTSLANLFSGCSKINEISFNNFDTSNVTDMNSMFQNCSGLTSLDLSSLDTSKVTNMSNMFNYCSSLTSLIITSDISKVTSYSSMFVNITTSGTLTYNCDYEDAWTNILVTKQSTSKFPSTWTKTCVTV